MRYSFLNIALQALRGHRDWQPVWRDAAPRSVLVGLIGYRQFGRTPSVARMSPTAAKPRFRVDSGPA